MTDERWIDLRAQGKMFGQISHDGRWLCFRWRGMVVVFDVRETLTQKRGAQTDVLEPIENCSQF